MAQRPQWFRFGKMLMAIALGSLGMMTAATACELVLPTQPARAETGTEISSAHPLALALAAAQEDGYVSEGGLQESIEITHESVENPRSATVVITQTGFLDDSVHGHKFTVYLVKNNLGNWRLININKEWICSRGRGESGLCL